jgi:CO/xanthine dehydrogenase FAD-binding subunit
VDLNTVQAVIRPRSRAELPPPGAGDAFLGGGTWMFSEPQTALRRLVDLPSLRWTPVEVTAEGLRIAATCTLAELLAAPLPPAWRSGHLVLDCCRALVASFKIWNTATVGGNLCLALPAASMAALAVALDGMCQIWTAAGGERAVAAADFIHDERRTALLPGEILREIVLPAAALRRTSLARQVSLTTFGRSAALLVGSRDGAAFHLTITAATPRPVRLDFAAPPDPGALAAAIDAAVPGWVDDLHGAGDWRRHVTHRAAEEIRAELAAG